MKTETDRVRKLQQARDARRRAIEQASPPPSPQSYRLLGWDNDMFGDTGDYRLGFVCGGISEPRMVRITASALSHAVGLWAGDLPEWLDCLSSANARFVLDAAGTICQVQISRRCPGRNDDDEAADRALEQLADETARDCADDESEDDDVDTTA